MGKKIHKVKEPKLKALESTGAPNHIKALQAEVAGLQKELKREKLRADACNKIIDIAEFKFNIPIRTKAGAKQ